MGIPLEGVGTIPAGAHFRGVGTVMVGDPLESVIATLVGGSLNGTVPVFRVLWVLAVFADFFGCNKLSTNDLGTVPVFRVLWVLAVFADFFGCNKLSTNDLTTSSLLHKPALPDTRWLQTILHSLKNAIHRQFCPNYSCLGTTVWGAVCVKTTKPVDVSGCIDV